MQRFAGLNSIEGWNLTFQLSKVSKIKKISKKYLPNGDLYDIIIIAVEEVDRQSMAPWSSG